MNVLSNSKERTRFFRFAVIGALGAMVDFSIYNFCINLLGFSAVLSGTISFIAAVTNNFIGNRYWTYPDSRSKPVIQQLGMFTLTNGIGLLIRIPLLWVLIPMYTIAAGWIPLDLPVTDTWVAENFALATAIGIVLIWNFVSNRYWTFSDVDKEE